jgi:serine-protein kinase ATM
MRYTRSVAVNSIVGHILGIGDRHGGNILIHKLTGEVVHIDFGIVFEQGRVSDKAYSPYCSFLCNVL